MDNIIYILFVAIFVPILLMALLVEKKARLPVVFMLLGIFVSVFGGQRFAGAGACDGYLQYNGYRNADQ